MALSASSHRILALLRNIPETALLAIVFDPAYANAVAMTSAPLPEPVFEYIANTYREDKRGLLLSRHLSASQRDYVLSLRTDPKYFEGFFNHNILTYEELSRVTRKHLTAPAAIDLLRHHRDDETAIAMVMPLMPKGLIDRLVKAKFGAPVVPVSPKLLIAAMVDDIVLPVETPTDLHPPYPISESVTQTWGDRHSHHDGASYDSAALTKTIGTEPATWLAFLTMLDHAGDTPVASVVATLVRAHTKTDPPALA